jgi:hypothetical protein
VTEHVIEGTRRHDRGMVDGIGADEEVAAARDCGVAGDAAAAQCQAFAAADRVAGQRVPGFDDKGGAGCDML